MSVWLSAAETNLWPLSVRGEKEATGNTENWQAVGPLFFNTKSAGNIQYQGIRPFYLHRSDDHSTYEESTFLYPLYTSRRDQDSVHWTVFNLINHSRTSTNPANHSATTAFDIWPVYFSRETTELETSYHAFFPIAGTIKSRFGYDRLQWKVFPLYWQTERAGVVTTSSPWPFIKHRTGNGHQGFAIWPLFGHAEKPGDYRHQFYLWPLIYKNESHLSESTPTVQQGFLPFYTHEQSADAISKNFLWPFFGYTKQREPVAYDEKRYFWPFLVQGRGDEHYVNRWGPFYTHSIRKGVDKKWFLWPLIRQEQWTADGLIQTKQQFAWFLYWSVQQRSAQNPQLPAAHKTFVWPLLSSWDNGAGRKQAQFPSPLRMFFPANDKVRHLYTPLFALYRFDQRSPEDVRHALLWNAISWHRTSTKREFHLGPIFSTRRDAAGIRIAIGHGLIGLRRSAKNHKWKLFLFDFRANPDKVKSPSAK